MSELCKASGDEEARLSEVAREEDDDDAEYDVSGDGNCLFRAVSLSINGVQDGHEALRQLAVAQIRLHGGILGGLLKYSPDDGLSFEKHVERLSTNGIAAGEDAISALADVCNRDIYVYSARANEPFIYKPSSKQSNCSPVQIAFYEPGHYKTVIKSSNDHASPQKSEQPSLNCIPPVRLELPV